jgi:PKD repeat protein
MKRNVRIRIAIVLPIVAVLMMCGGCGSNGNDDGLTDPQDHQAPTQLIAAITHPSGDVSVEVGEQVNFTGSASGGEAPYTYAWGFGDPALGSSTEQNPGLKQYDNEGAWTVRFTVTDADSDQRLDSLVVTVTPPPSFAVGNLLVTADNNLFEFTRTGTLVKAYDIPFGEPTRPGTEEARDLVYYPNGDAAVYNGTFEPYLSVYDPGARIWMHYACAGWSTVNNITYGGLARFQGYVFATDMQTYPAEERGIVRFDTQDNYDCERWGDVDPPWTTEYADVNLGLDGMLYAVEGVLASNIDIHVIDPDSLILRRVVTVPSIRAIAVNASGEMFGAEFDGMIYHFDSDGNVINSRLVGSYPHEYRMGDIDVSADGAIVVCSEYVHVTDESFGSVTTFAADPDSWQAFATFIE